ncbi:SDR family oxidoreductase [Nocardioides donggukensis]|uniref:NAD-dependent epimerase/dehydratase family protein n=1 Tax=Nocardioides donggukensis TaxID=2774019 RepID=A0A927K1R3_9ACTN|nr:NAD(P)H-binding protein [Nocardioides donggukensis]MBD8868584.1 NAD-dependent epimerase/dehydratase family protein [Nocardioides donggukensis]
MRIAVAGGTGVAGRHTVRALADAGHDVVVLARSHGVDLADGQGLDAALARVEVVVDTSNVPTLNRRAAVDFFTEVTSRLLAAETRHAVRHHVVLSIVGVDRVDTGYYAGKRKQEELVRTGDVPWSILRATQFHEFPGQLLDRGPSSVALLPRMRIQPVAAREVGEDLARIATGPPLGAAPELAGPEVHELVDLARQLAARRGRPRRVVGVPVPGRAGRAMASGALLPSGPATRGIQTYAEWLADADEGR